MTMKPETSIGGLARADGLDRSVALARKIWRRVAPAAMGPADVVGVARSERSDLFDTAEIVLRVGDHRYLIQVNEIR